jgi:acetyl-CoA carboxylase carboxyl transferase subunit alpha
MGQGRPYGHGDFGLCTLVSPLPPLPKRPSFYSDVSKSKAGASAGLPFEAPIREIEDRIAELESLSASTRLDISSEIEALRDRLESQVETTYAKLSAWDRVTVARHPNRPVTSDYITDMLDDFFELHGDKNFGDDRALVTGLASIDGRKFMLVAHRKGRNTAERLECNFGCAHPEGYRKALRKMKLAEKLGIPIITMINTPGAYPGIAAEERGQAQAIAENILGMFDIAVPIICVIIGEGGSGGALGIGVGDRVLMMEYAYYSVISPEGCAAILWKDGERSPDAAEALKLTADSLTSLGIVDEIIEEPTGGAHRNPAKAGGSLKSALIRNLDELSQVPLPELLEARYQKFRKISHIEGRFPSVSDAEPS